MANKLYEETDIQAIADAIRSKNGSTDTYMVSEMAQAIENILTIGKCGYARFYRANTGYGTFDTTLLTDHEDEFFTVNGNTITSKYGGYILTTLRLTTKGTNGDAHKTILYKNGSQLVKANASGKIQYNYSAISAGDTFKVTQYTDSASYPVTSECVLILIKS